MAFRMLRKQVEKCLWGCGLVGHLKQILTPGEQVVVRIQTLNPENKKLHLSKLPEEILKAETIEDNAKSRILVVEMQVDDELWDVF